VTDDTRLANVWTARETGTDGGADTGPAIAAVGVPPAVDGTADTDGWGPFVDAAAVGVVRTTGAVRVGDDEPHALHRPNDAMEATNRISPRRTPS
jgi:hypothetical protein